MRKSDIPFYLTGGTALGRAYFSHRYSDDLDFFTNRDKKYTEHVKKLLLKLEAAESVGLFHIDRKLLQKYEDFTQIFVYQTTDDLRIDLKIDIVNDIAAHYGDLIEAPVLGTVDSWRNILSNKLAAVFRYEAKDMVDIWIISKHESFEWMTVIEEAKSKEAGVDPVAIAKILQSFPPNLLPTIKWTIPPDPDEFCSDLSIIAKDILAGRANTLGPS